MSCTGKTVNRGPNRIAMHKHKPKVAIIGLGVVGRALQHLFGPETATYDIEPGMSQDRAVVNASDVAFVCVPTPELSNGECDVSAVEEVISWLETPLIVIRSTVAVGTTDRLRRETGKNIVFQPEYLGETPSHVYRKVEDRTFVILGGERDDCSEVADIYKQFYTSMVRFYFCDAATAELAKYMENCFFATKVAFVNEFYDIAKLFGVDFNELREVWLADSRISRDHTDVYPNARGFSGKCLPKDIEAIMASCRRLGHAPQLLEAITSINNKYLGGSAHRPADCMAEQTGAENRTDG